MKGLRWGHSHKTKEEIYFVISGTLRVKVDDEEFDIGPQEAIRLRPEVRARRLERRRRPTSSSSCARCGRGSARRGGDPSGRSGRTDARGGVGVGLVRVSGSSRAATSESSLSRLSASSRVTSSWASSTKGGAPPRPRAAGSPREVSDAPGSSGLRPSRGSTAIGPTASLMPQRPTMLRAISVSCWMSDSAPVGDLAEDDLLGHAAAQRHLDLRHQEVAVVGDAVGLGRRRRSPPAPSRAGRSRPCGPGRPRG